MSFEECTARSMAPASSASSISLVNRPLPPASASGRSWIMSPVVRMILISIRSAVDAMGLGEPGLHLVGLHQRQRRTARTDTQNRGCDRGLCHRTFKCYAANSPFARASGRGRQNHIIPMVILGIETTCDETAAAVVKRDRRRPGPDPVECGAVADQRARRLRRRGAGNRRPRPCRGARPHHRQGDGRGAGRVPSRSTALPPRPGPD